MLEVAANPKRLGAQIGFLSILHTWGQNLLLHPHIHSVVPRWTFSRSTRVGFARNTRSFLPVDVLSSVFRAKFVHGLRKASASESWFFPVPSHNFETRNASARLSIHSSGNSGSYTPSQRSARPLKFPLSGRLRIASPSAITAYWPSMESGSPSAGETYAMVTSSGR